MLPPSHRLLGGLLTWQKSSISLLQMTMMICVLMICVLNIMRQALLLLTQDGRKSYGVWRSFCSNSDSTTGHLSHIWRLGRSQIMLSRIANLWQSWIRHCWLLTSGLSQFWRGRLVYSAIDKRRTASFLRPLRSPPRRQMLAHWWFLHLWLAHLWGANFCTLQTASNGFQCLCRLSWTGLRVYNEFSLSLFKSWKKTSQGWVTRDQNQDTAGTWLRLPVGTLNIARP